MSTTDIAPKATKSRPALAWFQKLGRSLMLPIATLPVAGLLLRFGQDDLLGKKGLGWNEVASVFAAAGNAIFGNLPLIFAVAIAIGMAKKSDGSTALAGLVGYLVFKSVGDAMSPLVITQPTDPTAAPKLINFGVLGGLLIGIIAAAIWQRFHRTKLPTYLAFFGGRRLVPILTSIAALVLAVAMAFIYPAFDKVLTGLGNWTATNTILGGFVFGFANRMLIPLGLHHILNSTVWFQIGSCGTGAATMHGDLNCFFQSQGAQGGTFMTGFFPVMMFGLPAAAIAMWRHAKPSQRKVTGGIMLSAALTAFLTGITEPIEFAFMFVAFPLYLAHAVLTGISLALVNGLGIRDGFTFSAGGIDYLLNFGIATKPLVLLAIGLIYAAVYYVVFATLIKALNLKTPGREDDAEIAAEDRTQTVTTKTTVDNAEVLTTAGDLTTKQV